MSYETITAHGQTLSISSGEVLEDLLIDVTNGADITIEATGSDWTLRNIGVRGYYQGDGPLIRCRETNPDAESHIENVYLGDGAPPTGVEPTAISIGAEGGHAGTVAITDTTVEGFPNVGIDASTGPGDVSLERCRAANNGTANIQCRETGVLRDCVSFNDDTVYGWYDRQNDYDAENGAPLAVFAGGGGEADIYTSHLDPGEFRTAIATHGHADVMFYSGEMGGNLAAGYGAGYGYEYGLPGGVTLRNAVGDEPTHNAPIGAPLTAYQAASGAPVIGGGVQDPQPPDVPDPTFHQYGVAYYSEADRAEVTNADFIWEGDGRPLWAADGAQGYAHGRFALNPEVDDDYATDGGDGPGDVAVDAEDEPPEDAPGDAPEDGDDMADGSGDGAGTVELRITDCYVANIEEGPAIHIGADSDDATCVVENVHVNGAEVGILADGVTVEVRNCQINADERFATENGGDIVEESVGSSPSMPGTVPASVDEAARGNAFQDL